MWCFEVKTIAFLSLTIGLNFGLTTLLAVGCAIPKFFVDYLFTNIYFYHLTFLILFSIA